MERNPLQERKRTEMDGILIGLDAEQYKVIQGYRRIVCPNFGHPVLTSSCTKYK